MTFSHGAYWKKHKKSEKVPIMKELQVHKRLDFVTDHMYAARDRALQVLDELTEELSGSSLAYQSFCSCLHAMFEHEYDAAIESAYQSLQHAHRDGVTYIIVQAHMALGFMHDNRKVYDCAFEHYSAVLTYTESPRALNNIGNLYMLLDRCETAYGYFLRAEKSIDEAHPRVASIIYANMAECDCAAGRLDEAQEHLSRSQAYNSLYRETTPAFIHNIRALIEMKKGQHRSALKILEQAVAQIDQEGMLRYFLDVLRWTAQCHLQLGELEAALEKYLKIEELRIRYSYGLRVLSDIENLIDLYTRLGRDEEVCELYREYRSCVQEHVQARKAQNLENIQAQIRMQESREREERYAQLYHSTKVTSEIGREILSVDTSSEVLLNVRRRLSELFPVDRIAIGILDEYTGELEYQWESSRSQPANPVSIPLEQLSLEYQVIMQCLPVSVDLDEQHLELYRAGAYQDLYEDTASVLICPLHIEGSVLGLIGIHSFSAKTFTRYETELLSTVASFIAAVMKKWRHSSRLLMENRELERKTRTDALTGIGNRFAMEQRFRQLVHDHQGPVTLVMIDIDEFKGYNDRFGHEQGDSCLRFTAEVLSQHLDSRGNRLFRYGGDEFIAILIDQDSSEAARLLDEVCRDVEHRSAEGLRDTSAVTCSIGWHFSEDVSDMKDILHAYRMADAALYAAKAEGRNRVVASTRSACSDSLTSSSEPAHCLLQSFEDRV